MSEFDGYGVLPYGGGPAGGAAEKVDELFDLFCISGEDMFQISLNPLVTLVGSGSQFNPNPLTWDMDVCSGGSFLSANAQIIVTQNIPDRFTAEWIVKFKNLPNDFTDLPNSHIYLSVTDGQGPLLGFFFSKIGVAYTGDVSFPGGLLQLNCTFQQLPDSDEYISEIDYWVIRAATDYSLDIVYFYMTKLSELATLGHQLRAILPVIPYTASAGSPVDQGFISVRGSASSQSCAFLDSFCVGTSLIIPNLAPVANAGDDQAARACSIIQLDGSASFDPEGAALGYQWRLLEGPTDSSFVEQFYDGFTLGDPTGTVDKLYSTSLGALDAGADPIAIGDVINLDGVGYTIVSKGLDGTGFYIQIAADLFPELLSAKIFKYLRQRGISQPTSVKPTFFPDSPGFYTFGLVVSDGNLAGEESTTIVNVLESPLPRGCTPDLRFLFNYLSDFWRLVEDKDRIAVFWGSLAQAAATELFTLWQYEYSKSLRDIQRQFVRRWLHYDLLLPEPLPELTQVRALFGGITSSYFATAGVSGVEGTYLIISSPLLDADVTVEMTLPDPVTPAALASWLQDRLQELVDRRFTTQLITSGSTQAVRMDAPFPFTLGAGTTAPIFTPGDESRPPSGTGGSGVGTRTYKVGRSLEGLDIQEDDFLTLDGVAYRISRVVTNASDTYPYQRVVVKEEMPTAPSGTWSITGWVSSELLNFYNGLVSAGDYADFEVSEVGEDSDPASAVNELVETRVLGASAFFPGRISVDLWNVGQYLADSQLTVYLARVLRNTWVPRDVLVQDVPTLQEKIVIEDDEATLRRNVDYFLDEFRGRPGIRLVSGQSQGDLGDVWEGERPPDRLWAEYTYVNNNPLIEANFGLAAEFTLDDLAELPSTVDYLSAVRGIWYAIYNGPAIRNLRIGIQILLGLPFAEEAGVIEEIRNDFSPTTGRILIRDSANTELVRSYSYPKGLVIEENPETGVTYAVGDTVAQFAPLVEGAEVVDYIKDPEWFRGILNQGIFYEVEKFHKFLVRVDTAAFNLSALLFAQNFVRKVKPTYTYPLFFVKLSAEEGLGTDISITDDVTNKVKLILTDGPCSNLWGSSWQYDDPRAAGGGWRSQYDADVDPSTTPAWPTPESPIRWGFDKTYLCPDDSLVGIWCEQISGSFTVFFDGPLAYDTPVSEVMSFEDSSPGTIPAPPAWFTMTAVGDNVVDSANAFITKVRFIALGDPGSDPTDYYVSVFVNGTEEVTQLFTDAINTEVVFTSSFTLVAGDVITVRVRPASGTSSRSPNWSKILARVTIEGAAVWTYDETLGDGVYCAEKDL